MGPQTRKSLSTVSVEFLCTVLSRHLFTLVVLLKIPKAGTGFLISGHLLVSPPKIKHSFQRDWAWGFISLLWLILRVEAIKMRQRCSGNVWQVFRDVYQTPGRERIPIWCNFIAATQRRLPAPPHPPCFSTPPDSPAQPPPANPLQIKRKSKGNRTQWGQMKVCSL